MSAEWGAEEVDLVRRVDELVNATAKPLFVWRMAASVALSWSDTPQARSARTRALSAAREIDRLARFYAAHAEALADLDAERSLDEVD